ncbi:hypothetical protein AGMMS50212_01960 [Spirochaetia bacterium]|nr:hypothetical protein AGMMS50212_01960 [Spirochaetia bacterium]
MNTSAEKRLKQFQAERNAVTKGPLALLVQLTRMIQDKKFPLKADDFLTENKGQVAGLGGGNLKKILKEHGITQILASEGGRTSRGNMGLMMKYIEFLNVWNKTETIDFKVVETFWAGQVQEYFRNQPFTLSSDTSRTIAASLDELFEQAKKRQKQNPGMQYLGTMLQHLVAAKLSIILPSEKFEIHGASVADSPTDRSGDFIINNTIIHCTTAPGDPLIQKCKVNIRSGCLPVIITIFDRVKNVYDLAADADISGRVEVWDIQQFLSTNINEHGFLMSKYALPNWLILLKNTTKSLTKKKQTQALKLSLKQNELCRINLTLKNAVKLCQKSTAQILRRRKLFLAWLSNLPTRKNTSR